jgi:hypothetical protein
LSEWRKLVCGVMILILPTWMTAQNSAQAVLHNDGGVWLNGNPAPNSSAMFLHDVVQTQKGSLAKIDTEGSTITVEPETIVQFEGNEVVLEHGGLQLNTSRAMKVRVNCLVVIPLTEDWNRYDVVDVDGKVTVAAHQNDVKIHYQGASARVAKQARFSDVTVRQGEQAAREERCGGAARPPAADTGILNTTWAKGVGIAAAGAVICWAVCFGGGQPVSPAK